MRDKNVIRIVLGILMLVLSVGIINCGIYTKAATNYTYKVRFDGNGATEGKVKTITAKSGKKITIPENKYIKKGYTFDGWNTMSDGSGDVYVEGEEVKNLSKDGTTVRLYAQWKPNRYYVSFDGNNSTSGAMTRVRFTYGKAKKLPINKFARKGYDFVGWTTKSNGRGKLYKDGALVKNLVSTPNGRKTLYAKWKLRKYNIAYELDGGVNNADNPDSFSINSKTITLKEPTKKGYTFDGWYRSPSYKTRVTRIKSGSEGDRTYYAKWKVNSYYVKFDKNCDEKLKSMKTKKYVYGKKYKLPKVTFKRKNYTFGGWNTKPDGSGKSYDNEQIVRNLTSKNKGIKVLYAVWIPDVHSIKYVLNGGKNNAANPKSFTVDEEVVLEKPTRRGYTFAGWYKEAAWKHKITKISKGTGKDVKLYAKWKPNKLVVTFDGNGNTGGAMKTYTASILGTSYELADSTKHLKVIDVSSWQKKINWEKVKNEVDAVILRCGYGMNYKYQDDYEFERNAKECERLGIPYGVYLYSYATNDTKAKSEAAHILRLIEGKNLSLPVYLDCEEGYTSGYAARACEVIGNILQNNGYTFGVYANTSWWNNYLTKVTSYTRWVAQYYKVCQYTGTYDAWQYSSSGKVKGIEGNVDMNIMYTKFEQANVATYTIPANEYEKKGYKFVGWNTMPDGSGKTYVDEASIKNTYMSKNRSLKLYAQWELADYTIEYELDGGTNNPSNPTTYNMMSSDIILSAPTKEGYTFVAWYRDEDMTKKVTKITSGSTGNKKFYAEWAPIEYNIEYILNGGVNSVNNPLSYNHEEFLELESPVRQGYIFDGWYFDEAFEKKFSNDVLAAYGDLKLYAKWIVSSP